MSWMARPCHDRGGWNPPDPWGMVWRWGVTFTDHESDSHSSQEAWRCRTSLSSSDKEIKVAPLCCWAAQPHFPPIRSTRSSAPRNYRENTDREDVSSPWSRPCQTRLLPETHRMPNLKMCDVGWSFDIRLGVDLTTQQRELARFYAGPQNYQEKQTKRTMNPGLLHCRRILYQLSHKGSPRALETVAYHFSGVFPTQGSNWVLLHCHRILYQLSYQGSPENNF